MAVVVEVANERRVAARIEHTLLDFRNCRGGLWQVDSHPHHFRPSLGKLDALTRCGFRIRRVGHRHRLDDDGRPAAHLHTSDANSDRLMESYSRHSFNHIRRPGLVLQTRRVQEQDPPYLRRVPVSYTHLRAHETPE